MADLPDTSPVPSRRALRRAPVFVDASGRRLRRLRLTGLVALALAAGYVILLGVALLGGPNIAAPYLPQPAGPTAQAGASPDPAADSAAGAPGGGGVAGGPAAGVVPGPVAAPLTAATAAAAPAVPAANTLPAPAATGAPTSAPTLPGKSGTAPGQASKPAHP